MAWAADDPVIVLVALILAAALFMVEVALPTYGVAGLSALGLAGLAVVLAADQGYQSWPLVMLAVGTLLWAVLLTLRRTPAVAEVTAACSFAIGSVGYGLLARDPATIAVAVVGSAVLPGAFRPLLRATDRLASIPPELGMEALVGRPGTLVRWRDRAGTVRIDGSLWSARGALDLTPGTEVVVVGYDRMTLDVALPVAIR